MLEEAGFEVVLVNARHVKNVTGKKTDMSDAEWIRQLHSCGLLSASFQPDSFTRTLRTYMRHRKNLLEMSATHIHMMHKALEQMNIKLQHVIADITGKSGQAIIRAIIAGQRDVDILVSLLDVRIKASPEDVKRSLNAIGSPSISLNCSNVMSSICSISKRSLSVMRSSNKCLSRKCLLM